MLDVINIIKNNYKNNGVLTFISMSGCSMMLLDQYRLVNIWVQANDISALLDVVSTMLRVLMIVVIALILMNAWLLFITHKHTK